MRFTLSPFVCAVLLGCSTLQSASADTFVNPLKANGADPWMAYVDGAYHLSTTTGRDVRLRSAKHLADLPTAKDVVVWQDANPARNKALWAPEFHFLDTPAGKRWFLYYTA
ncbi:MAG: Extracellular exo-alpha-(1-_5)-L-arabinofuranosidase precursor, partial [Phycisphaerales bacterium]|nr:Extracellular exo-alpha-(1->5)-L-arabinofuranosidase precursor [Phycisphaerales bacterium]